MIDISNLILTAINEHPECIKFGIRFDGVKIAPGSIMKNSNETLGDWDEDDEAFANFEKDEYGFIIVGELEGCSTFGIEELTINGITNVLFHLINAFPANNFITLVGGDLWNDGEYLDEKVIENPVCILQIDSCCID